MTVHFLIFKSSCKQLFALVWEIILLRLIVVGRPILNVDGTLSWAGDQNWIKRRKSQAQGFIALCFLTVDAMKPATSSPCPRELSFPFCVTKHGLKLWGKISPSSVGWFCQGFLFTATTNKSFFLDFFSMWNSVTNTPGSQKRSP